jgi:hypothetical protein
MKRLFIDIETSPNIALVWRTGGKNFVSQDNIVKERAVICIAWKWESDNKVHTAAWNNRQCDKSMLRKVLKVITRANEVIAHNGDRFDLPWLRGRALIHGLPPLPLVRLVDTLKWARKYYYLNSNRLDYLGKILGVGGKTEKFKNGDGSWRRVLLDNNRDELGEMVEYCARDIELLEQVWKRLSLVCPAATHAGVANGGEKWSCPRCGGHNVYLSKRNTTAKGTRQFQMRCKSEGCRGYFTICKRAWEKWKDERFDYKEAA